MLKNVRQNRHKNNNKPLYFRFVIETPSYRVGTDPNHKFKSSLESTIDT